MEGFGKPLGVRNHKTVKRQSFNYKYNSLLVYKQTSNTKRLIDSFKQFHKITGINQKDIIERIKNHGKYIKFGDIYLKYNSRLPFLQKYRTNKTAYYKMDEFYKNFNMEKTRFWTVTSRTFDIKDEKKMSININNKRLRIQFEDIERIDKNLRALMTRLHRYGYQFKKYILVPEIKESNGKANYHFHIIAEIHIDIKKINKLKKYKDIIMDKKSGISRLDGWIDNKTLSEIWKDVTNGESYRIKPERIRSTRGAFRYILSYLNKPMQYEDVGLVPYLYYALKSRKSYRIKGERRLPKIEYKVLDERKRPILDNSRRILDKFYSRDEIPVKEQTYYIQVYRNNKLIEESKIHQVFSMIDNQGNYRLTNFYDEGMDILKRICSQPYNWAELEERYGETKVAKLLQEGIIFDSKEGYKVL